MPICSILSLQADCPSNTVNLERKLMLLLKFMISSVGLALKVTPENLISVRSSLDLDDLHVLSLKYFGSLYI